MLTRDACRTTPESFGVRRIACIVPVWATTQRTLLTCGAPLPNEAALQAAKKRGQRPGNPGIVEAATAVAVDASCALRDGCSDQDRRSRGLFSVQGTSCSTRSK